MTDAPDTRRYGGYTDVARVLSTPQVAVSRQGVYSWWLRRDGNGFPDRHLVHGTWLFDIDEVLSWHETYVPYTPKRGRPRKRDIDDVVEDL
jgi:hypothetical protein